MYTYSNHPNAKLQINKSRLPGYLHPKQYKIEIKKTFNTDNIWIRGARTNCQKQFCGKFVPWLPNLMKRQTKATFKVISLYVAIFEKNKYLEIKLKQT